MKKIILIKLGGSLITNKDIPFSVNEKALDNLVKEIKYLYEDHKYSFIIGHGGGSFPHVYAKRYNINEGFKNKDSYMGFCKVQNSAVTLNRIVVNKFVDAGLPVSMVQISNNCMQRDGKIVKSDLSCLYKMINYNMIPIVYGDVSFDENKDCSVISTEEIFRYISEDILSTKPDMKLEYIILCGNVDGVMTADPNSSSDAKLISKISLSDLTDVENFLQGAIGFDVTGGMKHKVYKMLEIKGNIAIRIINGSIYGELSNALHGYDVGTVIDNSEVRGL